MAKTLDLGSLTRLNDLMDLGRAAQENQIILLSVDQIEVKPQVRKDFKEIEELAASYDDEGQQTPIIVGPMNPETQKYPLKKGGRRYAAAVLRPGFKLKAIVDGKKRTPAKEILSQLIENEQRQNLNPYEVGQALAEAKAEAKAAEEPLSNQDLATYMGKSETYISIHLGLADLPEELVDLIKGGVTSDSEVLREMKQLKNLQPETFTAFIERAKAEGSISRQQVRDAVRAAKGKTVPTKAPPAQEPQTEQQAGKVGHPSQDGVGKGGNSSQANPPSQTDQSPVSHAKPEGQSKAQGQGETNTPAAVTTPSQEQGPAAAPNSSSKKNGKGYIPITAERQVIGIKVALDSAVASGYLMNDRVSEDPSKAWCMLMIGGSQQPKQIKVDQIDIVSVAAMETDG